MTHPTVGDLFDYAVSREEEGRRHEPSQREAGEVGMKRAVDHAERESEGWAHEALQYARLFASLNVGREYLAEEIAPWAHNKGCPIPPDKRAWGAIIKKAIKLNIIENTGRTGLNRLSGNASQYRPIYRTLQPKEPVQ
jgi:hypothetical protein